jgi:hypothetical protein
MKFSAISRSSHEKYVLVSMKNPFWCDSERRNNSGKNNEECKCHLVAYDECDACNQCQRWLEFVLGLGVALHLPFVTCEIVKN